MQTNIDIDDALLAQAMEATGAATKETMLEIALRRLVAHKTHENTVAEVFRLQEIDRNAAEREGRLDEWHAKLVKKGNWPEFPSEAQFPANGEELLSLAMSLTGLTVQKATIEEALRYVVQRNRQAEAIRGIWGLGWDGDLDAMRRSRFPDWDQNPIEEPLCANTPAA
jgi:Arc/MetJ family transcription regulator